MNSLQDIPMLLGNDAATLDDEGWALIAPFGEHPKTRVVKKNGRLVEEKFIQVLDNESADQLLSRENSIFRRIRRAVVGIPVYKGHPDLRDYAPETAGAALKKELIGTIDRVRKTARGIEANFVLTPAGADAVENQGCKYPSALWLVQPIGQRGDATLARPFKLLSAGLTAHPNICGVESLAVCGLSLERVCHRVRGQSDSLRRLDFARTVPERRPIFWRSAAMKFVHVGRLQRAAAARKSGYVEAHMKRGQVVQIRGMPFVQISDADYAAIGEEFALAKKPAVISAGPGAAKPGGAGLGDAIHKAAGPIGRAIKWPCMKNDGSTDLIPGSPCDRARRLLNKL